MKISRKILLTILAAAAITTSCADKFSISGTLPAAVKADSVYLYPVDMSSTPVPICAVPVENGQFSIKGLVPDTVTLAVVHPGRPDQYPNLGWNIILEKGKITLDTTSEFASGTPLNDGLADWMSEITPLIQMMMSQIDHNPLAEFYNAHWSEHASDFVGPFFLMQTWSMLDIKQVESMIAQIPDNLKNVYLFKKYLFDPVAATLELQPGRPFKDASLKNIDGNPAKLSDFIGQGSFTLVDFWASWCKPCREAMPDLKNLAQNHTNLKVLGVAIRDKDDETRQAIQQLEITWPVLTDPQVQTGTLYGFDAIPFMILFDPQGNIVARGVHPGPELDSILTANNL